MGSIEPRKSYDDVLRRVLEMHRDSPFDPRLVDRLLQDTQHSGSIPQSILGGIQNSTNQAPPKPEDREKRRKSPKLTLGEDLEVGDILVPTNDANTTLTVVEKEDDSIVLADSTGHKISRYGFTSGRGDLLMSHELVLVAQTVKKETLVDFDTVILSEKKKQAIIDAIRQVDNSKLIFEDWGFGKTFEKGRAISMLFYGPPGTGKTLMGQAVADKYGYKLKVISTAEIESSEPGQAERNIKAFFEAAEKDKKTVLLFDECDSLIHDRASIGMILGAQVNALLTALEQYTGIAIFTTNQLGSLDAAFDRRLSLKLEFEMPSVEHRILIWQRMFPDKAPLGDDISWEDLASVEIAGGHIKNVVLRAARKAANLDMPNKKKRITMDILFQALKEEVKAMTQFQHSLNSKPRLMGGGLSYGAGVEKRVEVDKVKEEEKG